MRATFSGPTMTAAAQSLLAWYATNRRDLPWRREPDPYRVWISEIMLQQTTVAAAAPYYERFLARFPDLDSLGSAREEEVLALWSGLGYYHRARHLLAAARLIRERHAGRVPDDPAALRALPGVGAYTAGAILSIGHGIPAAALDGNAVRVLARLAGVRDPVERPATRRRLERIVMEMMPAAEASLFNQALMDLGAMVCLPAGPQCGRCPVAASCAARRSGRTGSIPRVPVRLKPIPVNLVALVATRRAGRPGAPGVEALLVKRKEGALLGGMWEFPLAPRGRGALDAARALADGLGLRAGVEAGRLRHTITRHAITITMVRAEPPGTAAWEETRGGGEQSRGFRDGGRGAGRATGRLRTPVERATEASSGEGRRSLPQRLAAARLATPIGPRTPRRWIDLARIANGSEAAAITGAARKIVRSLCVEGEVENPGPGP